VRDARLAATLLAAPRAEWVECYRALLPPLEDLTHLGGALQVETRVCKHGIRHPSPWVSDSTPVCDAM
jgi:hypothetical protein